MLFFSIAQGDLQQKQKQQRFSPPKRRHVLLK